MVLRAHPVVRDEQVADLRRAHRAQVEGQAVQVVGQGGVDGVAGDLHVRGGQGADLLELQPEGAPAVEGGPGVVDDAQARHRDGVQLVGEHGTVGELAVDDVVVQVDPLQNRLGAQQLDQPLGVVRQRKGQIADLQAVDAQRGVVDRDDPLQVGGGLDAGEAQPVDDEPLEAGRVQGVDQDDRADVVGVRRDGVLHHDVAKEQVAAVVGQHHRPVVALGVLDGEADEAQAGPGCGLEEPRPLGIQGGHAGALSLQGQGAAVQDGVAGGVVPGWQADVGAIGGVLHHLGQIGVVPRDPAVEVHLPVAVVVHAVADLGHAG